MKKYKEVWYVNDEEFESENDAMDYIYDRYPEYCFCEEGAEYCFDNFITYDCIEITDKEETKVA